MDYNLDALDERNFEHVVQALALGVVGPNLTVFGDGPDGGREASWTTSDASIGEISLNLYGVLQAKHRLHPSATPASNAAWLLKQVTKDVLQWEAAQAKRRAPEAYFVATNVSIGSAAGGGKDTLPTAITKVFKEQGLPEPVIILWDRDDIRARLDRDVSVRERYSAWITPSTVLADLLDRASAEEQHLLNAIHLHAAASIKRERNLKLSQTGNVGDETMSISNVFIDLPCDPDRNAPRSTLDQSQPSAAARSIAAFDRIQPITREAQLNELVLVGGPGQGKSTVTQFLALYYRTLFLESATLHIEPDIINQMRDIRRRAEEINLPVPVARRWPMRINLPDLADAIAEKTDESLLAFIAREVAERSGLSLNATTFVKWLARMPWALILDGLDEVPESSNRRELFEAIETFVTLSRTLNADVVILGTTRPQGYHGEFGRADHVNLLPLPADIALRFADTFLMVKNGPDFADNERTSELLSTAIHDDASVRLFETPLQVTILAVLLERLGHAPSNKWSLFSTYYGVILQREQGKPGKLAKLLQEFGPQITYLHRHVGNLLQERGAKAGTSQGSLSKAEFRDIVVARLIDRGHSEMANTLTDQLLELATDRLVFLAMLTPDTVGFELRSFQEFMSGEQIIADRGESDALARLREISGDYYWRNTFLFAAGHIFQNRDVLKSALLQITQELDVDDIAAEEAGRGRELALDILAEDLCVQEPIVGKPMAKHAASMVGAIASQRSGDLASLHDRIALSTVESYIEGTAPGDLFDFIGRARFMSADSRAIQVDTARQAAIDLFDSAPPTVRSSLLTWAWREQSDLWEFVARERWNQARPFDFMSRTFRLSDEDAAGSTPWDALRMLSRRSTTESRQVRLLADDEVTVLLNASIVPLGNNNENWTLLAAVSSDNFEWQLVASLAQFAVNPSAQKLSEFAQAYIRADVNRTRVLALSPPWPVVWATSLIDQFDDRDAHTFITLIGQTKFGDLADWISAEGLFQRDTATVREFLSSPARYDRPAPLRDIPFEAASLSFATGGPANEIERVKQVETIFALFGSDFDLSPRQRDRFDHLLNFMLSMATTIRTRASRLSPDLGDSKELKAIFSAHSAQIEASSSLALARKDAPVWLHWMTIFSGRELLETFSESFVSSFGHCEFHITEAEPRLARDLLDRAHVLGATDDRLTLVVLLDPALAPEAAALSQSQDPNNFLVFINRLFTHSSDLAEVISDGSDFVLNSRTERLLRKILSETSHPSAGLISAHVARFFRASNDLRAANFVGITRRRMDPTSADSTDSNIF